MRLSATSALVLRWMGDAGGAESGALLSRLDLSEADNLFDTCQAIWPHYAEVIKNRKHAVLHFACDSLRSDQGPGQVVILGAGFDILSIELAVRFPGISLFELDRDNMPAKAALLKDAAPATAARIHCLEADLADPAGLGRTLAAAGWRADTASLVVAEGISYYLPRSEFSGLLGLFTHPQSRMIVEYLLPAPLVAPAHRDIPARIFGAIMRQCDLAAITAYAPEAIAALATSLGCRVEAEMDLCAMERGRTGGNRYFADSGSGWIRVACWRTSAKPRQSPVAEITSG